MSERDADQAAAEGDAEGFPKRSGLPDPRAFLLAILPILDALTPAVDAAREVRPCHT